MRFNPFGMFGGGPTPPRFTSHTLDDRRMQRYARFLRTYQGYAIRSTLPMSVVPDETKRIKFNFSRPIVNLSAAFLASKPLGWEVKEDPDAQTRAGEIWDRSVEEGSFYEAALSCSINGDLVVVVSQDERKRSRLEFVEASICNPTFSGKNCSELTALDISFEEEDREGKRVRHREFYEEKSLTIYRDDEEVQTIPYTSLPAAWICNQRIKGEMYGVSDLDGVVELVLEYDHLATKQTQIVDYHAAPTPVISGLQKTDEVEKNLKSIWFLPDAQAKAYLMELSASPDMVEAQLTRIRNAISEVSQVPAIAFGQHDSGLSAISGVAMQILYGPLIAKMNAKRGAMSAGLEYCMAVALRAEGFTVEADQIKTHWEDPLPKDVLGEIQAENAKVGGKLSSIRSAMDRLGVDNPEAEMKRILVEGALTTAASQSMNPQPAPQIGPDGQERPVQTPVVPAEAIGEVLDAFDAVIEAEQADMEEAEAERERED